VENAGIPRTQKPLMTKSQMKTMLIFSNTGDAVHFGFIPNGQRFNQEYYMEMLKVFAYVCLENTGIFSQKLTPRI